MAAEASNSPADSNVATANPAASSAAPISDPSASSPANSSASVAPEVTSDASAASAGVETNSKDVTPSSTDQTVPENKTEIKVEVKEPTTVLGQQKKEEVETKDSEGVKPEVKKDEASQSEEAPLPTYELKVPDNVELNDNEKLEFTTLLGQYENRIKADPSQAHAATEELANGMLAKHLAVVQDVQKKIEDSYKSAWDTQTKNWLEDFKKDPEIGGNRFNTTVGHALDAIKMYGGTEAQQAEFHKLMETTGIGNHPAMIRFAANVMQARPEPKQLPAQKPMPQVVSKVQRRYGGKNQ